MRMKGIRFNLDFEKEKCKKRFIVLGGNHGKETEDTGG
jgi:hypothetical protein